MIKKAATILGVLCFLIQLHHAGAFAQTQPLELVDRIWFPSTIWPGGDTTGGSDVWGYTAPDSTEYAIMGVLDGIAFVRVPDMTVIDVVPGPKNNDFYYHRDIKTYRHYAYAVAEMTGTNQGLMVIDLQYLPDSVHFVGSFTNGGDIRSHNLSIDTAMAYAYVLKQNYSGVRIISLADPENPTDVGTISAIPDVHDVFARNDTAWIAEGFAGSFSVFDVSDKGTPVLITRVTPPSAGYAHNIWPTDDGRYFLTTEETDFKTVKVWDMLDPGNVTIVGNYLGASNLAHNVHVKGDYVHISHYESGVSIIDISDPTNPIEVATYDTYAASNNPDFYGCWGAYPFTIDNYVYASDLEGYLTVLKFYPENITGVSESPAVKPAPYQLLQNYPNPFNPSTSISFVLKKSGHVTLTVYDLLGQKIKTLVTGSVQSGEHKVNWDGTNDEGKRVSSGVYVYRLEAGDSVRSKKMLFLK